MERPAHASAGATGCAGFSATRRLAARGRPCRQYMSRAGRPAKEPRLAALQHPPAAASAHQIVPLIGPANYNNTANSPWETMKKSI